MADKIVKIGNYLEKRRAHATPGAQCIVTYASGKRKFVNLGAYGSEESIQKYNELVRTKTLEVRVELSDVRIAELFSRFISWGEDRVDHKDLNRIRQTLKIVFEFQPDITVADFTALHFRKVIDKFQEIGAHPRKRKGRAVWSRAYINRMIQDVKRVFRWGVSWDLVTPDQRERVLSVPTLRKRDTTAPEAPGRVLVTDADVLATLPYMSQTVQDMVLVQRGAAMRTKEICTLRVGDLDKSRSCWCACSGRMENGMSNKTDRFGTKRFVAFSLEETKILRRNCAGKPDTAYVFASDYERLGTRGFTTSSYGHAIRDAILLAHKDGKKIPFWTSYQLRHAGITAISLSLGHEAAQYAAGHTNPKTTEIYDHKAAIVSMDAASKRKGWWEE